jgi:hypothetical protein
MTTNSLIDLLDQIQKEIINECIQAAIDTGKPDTYHLAYAKHRDQIASIDELKAKVLAGDTTLLKKIRDLIMAELTKPKGRKIKEEKAPVQDKITAATPPKKKAPTDKPVNVNHKNEQKLGEKA